MPLSRRGFLAGAGASGSVALAAPAFAQKYPSAAPIRLIVPFAAAGPVDILARIIVDPLGKQLGQSIVIENRGGAGGNVGIAAAARSRADGYTLLLCSSSLVVNPLLYKSVPFDPYKDFVPISLLGTSPTLMLAKHDVASGHARHSSPRPRPRRASSTLRRRGPAPRGTSRSSCSRRAPGSTSCTCRIRAAGR